MTYTNTRELKNDVLFRASESQTAGVSAWETKVIDYLNKNYRELCLGASAYLPEYVDDWWWMRSKSQFLLQPVYQTGVAQVTNNGSTVIFTPTPTIDLIGRRFAVLNQSDPNTYIITVHGANNATAILDTVFTGSSNTNAKFQVMKTDYDLTAAIQVIMGPMVIFGSNDLVYGVSPERMDELFPINRLVPGIPKAFAIVNEGDTDTVRFSHGGDSQGRQLRVEYKYKAVVADLADTTGSIPLVPAQWRHVLSDMALTQVLLDKNDDRANAAALGARTILAAMLKENRRRNVKIDNLAGHITPRHQNLTTGKALRTASGLIIG